jgi:tetratricopeptide (TPR) repeat protein
LTLATKGAYLDILPPEKSHMRIAPLAGALSVTVVATTLLVAMPVRAAPKLPPSTAGRDCLDRIAFGDFLLAEPACNTPVARLFYLGVHEAMNDHYEMARSYLRRAVELLGQQAPAPGDPAHEVVPLANAWLGLIAARAGEDPKQALPLCEKALQAATALKNKNAEGLALVCRATFRLVEGDAAQFEADVAAARQTGDPPTIGKARILLAQQAMEKSPEEYARLLQETVDDAYATLDTKTTAGLALAGHQLSIQREGQAEVTALTALGNAQRSGVALHLGLAHHRLCHARWARGNAAWANANCDSAVDIFMRENQLGWLGKTYLLIATIVAGGAGKEPDFRATDLSLAYYRQALQYLLVDKDKHTIAVAEASRALCRLEAKIGNHAEGLHHCARVKVICTELGDERCVGDMDAMTAKIDKERSQTAKKK